MRKLLRFLRPARVTPSPLAASGGTPSRPPNAGTYYWSRGTPLTANQVRERQFGRARRGLDPEEVQTFLDRVANELAVARAEAIRTREENLLIKRALRDWQSRFAPGARR